MHSKEDEFSFVLEGRVSVRLGDDEHVAEVGDLVFKPRGQWHTFWNAEDEPARLLELISPGGLEDVFRAVDTATDDTDLGALIAAAGCEGDPEATQSDRRALRAHLGLSTAARRTPPGVRRGAAGPQVPPPGGRPGPPSRPSIGT